MAPSEPVNPALALHLFSEDDPATLIVLLGQTSHVSDACEDEDLKWPAAHRAHAALLIASLKDPAGHADAISPSVPVNPALAWHADCVEAPAELTVLLGHATHVLDVSATDDL